jgi:rfaE bifunctional protein nucleotidyltransferase chain/domain
MNDCLRSLEDLLRICESLKAQGKRIVTTNGTFDLLHPGHMATLRKAKDLGDILIVAINSDESIKKLKGKNRPILHETERAIMLCALRWVDYVLIFDEETPLLVLQRLKPDYHVKGGTFIQDRVDEERNVVETYGGRFVTLDLVDDYSTTKIIEACRRVVP